MKRIFLHSIILATLVSCGAAKNDKSRSGDPPPNNGDRTIQPADAEEFQKSQRTHMYRNKESQQLNYFGERKLIASKELPKTHRLIPDMDRDHDGNVIKPEKIDSPELGCGNYDGTDAKQPISMKQRHNNCKEVHGVTNAVEWSGKNKAIMGEGSWWLIANSPFKENNVLYNKIVWMDISTGLLWSDTTATYSWEEATGIKNTDTRPCLAVSKSPKHELGKIHPDFVSWRIPNRNEFLQADINGSRFVLPNSEEYIWTGSFGGTIDGVDKAWAIKVETGELKLMDINTELSTRCIGVVLK